MPIPAPDARKAAVLFSGGLDSTVALFWAAQRYDEVLAVTFDYGQRNRKELVSAEKIPPLAGAESLIIPIPMFGDSYLLQGGKGAEHVSAESEFVPGRNLIMLAYLSSIAAQRSCEGIIVGTDAHPALNHHHPDTRFATILKFGAVLDLGLYGKQLVSSYRAPLSGMSKTEILAEAELLPGCVDALEWSTSCFFDTWLCRDCPSCVSRSRAFLGRKQVDPVTYRKMQGKHADRRPQQDPG